MASNFHFIIQCVCPLSMTLVSIIWIWETVSGFISSYLSNRQEDWIIFGMASHTRESFRQTKAVALPTVTASHVPSKKTLWLGFTDLITNKQAWCSNVPINWDDSYWVNNQVLYSSNMQMCCAHLGRNAIKMYRQFPEKHNFQVSIKCGTFLLELMKALLQMHKLINR